MNIAFLGFNSFLVHKRGVENVIDFQSKATNFEKIYYLHLGERNSAYRYKHFICISVKKNIYWPLYLNLILFRLKSKKKVKIHSHTPLLSFAYLGITDILTVHDALFYQSKALKSRFVEIFFLIEKLVYLKVKIVHFISHFSKSNSLFPNKNKNFEIIYNTSSFEEFFPLSLSEEQHSSANIKKVLCVRSIEERARFDLLIEVAEKLPDFDFTVAGKGPLLEKFRGITKARNLNNLVFLGYVSDNSLLDLYRLTDLVLVLAEYGEGFGLPIIEGYLFNKPVVASNVCAIPEVINDKFFLTANTVEDICGKLLSIEKYKPSAYRNYYENKFSNKLIMNKFSALYKRIF